MVLAAFEALHGFFVKGRQSRIVRDIQAGAISNHLQRPVWERPSGGKPLCKVVIAELPQVPLYKVRL